MNDFSRFRSRLHYRARLIFDTAHRIGAEQSLAVESTDLPVLTTQDGRPYIPGSSFKGALRSYTESVLRALKSRYGGNIVCNPLIDEDSCMSNTRVKEIKNAFDQDPAAAETHYGHDLDGTLRNLSCATCRLFGNNVVSSKVMFKDLDIDESSFLRTQIRDGVAIDRDAARAADGMKYTYEVVPAAAIFNLEIVVENADEAQLGLLFLGLKALERGDIQLGGNKSRGLGWCHVEPALERCHYVTDENLLDYLLTGPDAATTLTNEMQQAWLQRFRTSLTGESDDA